MLGINFTIVICFIASCIVFNNFVSKTLRAVWNWDNFYYKTFKILIDKIPSTSSQISYLFGGKIPLKQTFLIFSGLFKTAFGINLQLFFRRAIKYGNWQKGKYPQRCCVWVFTTFARWRQNFWPNDHFSSKIELRGPIEVLTAFFWVNSVRIFPTAPSLLFLLLLAMMQSIMVPLTKAL